MYYVSVAETDLGDVLIRRYIAVLVWRYAIMAIRIWHRLVCEDKT